MTKMYLTVGNGNPPPPDDPKGKKSAPVKKEKSK